MGVAWLIKLSVARNTESVVAIHEHGNPSDLEMGDDNGNLYDPDAWEDMDVEMEDLNGDSGD